MRMIVKAEVVFDDGSVERSTLATFDRSQPDLSVGNLGLTLEDGKQLLRQAQQCLGASQAKAWLQQRAVCCSCGWSYPHKDVRTISVRTVFGLIKLPSPRWYRCVCAWQLFGRQPTWSPLPEILRQRITPELELLIATAAAEQPYARAVDSLRAVLPVEDCISVSGAKNRIRAVAAELDEAFADDCCASHRRVRKPPAPKRVRSIAIDSVWLRHHRPTRGVRQVSVAVARATLANGQTKVCGYVTKQVTRSSARVDGFLASLGVKPSAPVTAVADGAGEFETAIGESRLAGQRIVDWFHIAMKFQAAQLTMSGMRGRDDGHAKALCMRVDRAKLSLWHGRAREALSLLENMPEMVSLLYAGDSSTLQRNLEKLVTYLRSNRLLKFQ